MRSTRSLSLNCAVALAALILGCAPQPPNGEASAEVTYPLVIDLGCVARGTAKDHVFRVVARERPLVITDWKTSCDCLRVYPETLSLDFGEEAFVQLIVEEGGNDDFIGDLEMAIEGFDRAQSQLLISVRAAVVASDSLSEFQQLEH
jgi:hypothetical protein